MSTQKHQWSKRALFRLALLIIIGGWISLSPAYRQVLGGDSKWFPRWIMFNGFGRQVCDVRFYEPSAMDGSLQPLDRFQVLNKPRSWQKHKSLVRMDRFSDVKKVTRIICDAQGPNGDVRVFARCGSRGKWKVKQEADHNACDKGRHQKRKGPRG